MSASEGLFVSNSTRWTRVLQLYGDGHQIKVSGIEQTLIRILVSSLDALINVTTSPLGLSFLLRTLKNASSGIVGRSKTQDCF